MWCSSATASMMIDLVTKPENSGTAEIEAAPTMVSRVVCGIDFHSPPRSLPFAVPVRIRTAPMPMKSSPLNTMSATAWAEAPLMPSSPPMPTPTTMKPSWLIML